MKNQENIMSCKKLLLSAVILSGIMFSMNAYAADLEASVEKNRVAKKYPDISKMIEYNNYSQADSAIKNLLAKNNKDIDALALEVVSLAKQHKLAPAQTRLDKLLKEYPNHADLHYAQGLVYMMRQTSSDVDYIKQSRELTKNAIREFVDAVNLDSNFYEAYNALGVATLKLGNKKEIVLQLMEKYKLSRDEVLYVGDDVNDMESMLLVKYKVAPPNANNKLKELEDIQVTVACGGDGVFREIVDTFIQVKADG